MARTAHRLDTQGTIPGGGPFTPDDEDYMSFAERAQILSMFKPAGIQHFADEAEQLQYLRLVEALSRPEPLSGATWALLIAGTVVVGIATGLVWRRYRQKKAQTAKTDAKPPVGKLGLDLLGVSS